MVALTTVVNAMLVWQSRNVRNLVYDRWADFDEMMSMEHARWRHLRPEGPLTDLRLVQLSSALRRYLAQTNSKKQHL